LQPLASSLPILPKYVSAFFWSIDQNDDASTSTMIPALSTSTSGCSGSALHQAERDEDDGKVGNLSRVEMELYM